MSNKESNEISSVMDQAKSLAGIENVNDWIQHHTILVDGQQQIIIPYTADVMVATKGQTSSLDDDLRNIDKHIKGVLDGSILVGHAAKANKLTTPRQINLSGDVAGSVSFDGSEDVTLPVTISDNSHNHIIPNVEGLQEALDEKLTIEHDHPKWAGFKTIQAGDFNVNAIMPEDTLNFIAGKNILLSTNDKEKSITIDAVMTDVEASIATTLRGIRIQFDANRSQNEQYIPVVSYSLPLEIGREIDFHLSGSAKDFDARLLINTAGVLSYTINGQETYRLFHEGNDGPGSGFDADTLDGKHATSFSDHDHNHDERYLSGTNGEMTTDLILSNGKFIKGRKRDNSIHQLIGLSGGDTLDLGSTTVPMTIWSQGNPTVGVGDSKKAIYHEGNKPTWERDILNVPTEFTPATHTHPSSDIRDATSNNTPNTVVRRDSQGGFSASQLVATSSLRVGVDPTGTMMESLLTPNSLTFYSDGVNRIVAANSKTGSIAFHTGLDSIADVLKLNSDGSATFGGSTSVAGRLTVNGGSNVSGGSSINGALTVSELSTFKNGLKVTGNSEFVNQLTVHGTISANLVDMGNYLKLNTGADGTGFDNRNNANVDTWFGFSISNLCPGQIIPTGKPAFSVNARDGNTYAAGNFYANKTKRVYHEGNFFFSTSDNPSGGVNGDLWFTYEG